MGLVLGRYRNRHYSFCYLAVFGSSAICMVWFCV